MMKPTVIITYLLINCASSAYLTSRTSSSTKDPLERLFRPKKFNATVLLLDRGRSTLRGRYGSPRLVKVELDKSLEFLPLEPYGLNSLPSWSKSILGCYQYDEPRKIELTLEMFRREWRATANMVDGRTLDRVLDVCDQFLNYYGGLGKLLMDRNETSSIVFREKSKQRLANSYGTQYHVTLVHLLDKPWSQTQKWPRFWRDLPEWAGSLDQCFKFISSDPIEEHQKKVPFKEIELVDKRTMWNLNHVCDLITLVKWDWFSAQNDRDIRLRIERTH
ncbi:uncharacterized protein LOC107368204 [Tetranychus urticae]|uniref:Uncharacterized protein n=1 Tax=Tetranychus urticae TaxID=32264 RepID=T1KY29_TETUR|nr:uncharacterized protein LOC107368204 [Tetranychus urticae]